MSNFAIKGHSTRGKEIIEILQMFGGNNKYNITYTEDNLLYCLRYKDNVIIATYPNSSIKTVLSIEEFLEKFPYKVGDKVQRSGATSCGSIYVIEYMKWNDNQVEYVICDLYWKNCKCTVMSKDLQPYKEETMKDYLVTEEDYEKTLEVEQEYIDAAERLIDQLADGTRWKCKDFDSQKMIALFLKKNTSIITEKEDSIIVDIPKGYEFAGVDDDNQKVVFEKICCNKYPKTYDECCKIYEVQYEEVSFEPSDYVTVYERDLERLLLRFRELLICRDTYWKIAGEQMGFGKPWKTDLENEELYCIQNYNNQIVKSKTNTAFNKILIFPTEEMRDTFYENFKELIESCKELL